MAKKVRYLFLVWAMVLFVSTKSHGQVNYTEKRLMIALRAIGHQLLLDSDDRLSLVLPIIKDWDHYSIRFGTDLTLNTEKLIVTVDSVLKSNHLTPKYIIEVQECSTKQIVYSYEQNGTLKPNNIACKGRMYDKGCYVILFTPVLVKSVKTSNNISESNNTLYLWFILLFCVLLITIVAFALYYRKKKTSFKTPSENLISIGNYFFDPVNSMLLFENNRVELSGKESELLLLLYHTANTTVEREHILKTVWNDEGNYVGRTLDVFISKLRKKLEQDSNIKIMNIRGTGYKLVLNSNH